MYQEIALTDHLNQRIKTMVRVKGADIVLEVQLRWQKALNLWTMSVWNENGEALALRVPVLSGIDRETGNIVKPFLYLGFGSVYAVPRSVEFNGIDPTDKNLHKDYALIWGGED